MKEEKEQQVRVTIMVPFHAPHPPVLSIPLGQTCSCADPVNKKYRYEYIMDLGTPS